MRAVGLALVLVMIGGRSGAAPALKPPPAGDPRLVGRWAVARAFNGREEVTKLNRGLEYEFRADGRWVIRRDGKEYLAAPGRYTADPGATPAAIDLVPQPADPMGPVVRGVYKVDGDTLTLHTRPGADRPAGFEPAGAASLMTLTRVRVD